MRFESLTLERYGRFENRTLDLSGDQIRLHVVFGPNEAGKSTVLSAIADLLFGVPARTSFAGLPPGSGSICNVSRADEEDPCRREIYAEGDRREAAASRRNDFAREDRISEAIPTLVVAEAAYHRWRNELVGSSSTRCGGSRRWSS